MSSNDETMKRLLFAILQQKDLKDIDWEKVANSPYLPQKISNGHAARMRYARYKQTVMGTEPQRRNRANPNKARVTKKKNADRAKMDEAGEYPIKSEHALEHHRDDDAFRDAPIQQLQSPTIKEEGMSAPNSGLHLTGMAMTSKIQSRPDNTRLLTPCSDSEALASSPGFTQSPVNQLLHADASLDFPTQAHCSHSHAVSWHQSPAYAGFAAGYSMDNYSNAYYEPQPDQQHAADELGLRDDMAEHEDDHVMVKHEDWDSQYC
ncbi:hypothetical protein B0T22DRAFT_468642 [Podospora appendiculata]|uniref:Myb-like DNA-binding domain-containing protein n=1 Tax=Podospora appendiculata TaxID=314037 RepID=A0AAE0X2T8_9PEZI|nr:hypothetical protein B0T22DRAFT_468642 [Podospora appendiculata]